MDRFVKRMFLRVVAASFAVLLSGIFSAVNAQSTITCCLTKRGKLKNCELGENPRKECKKNQTVVPMQLSDGLSSICTAAVINSDHTILTIYGQFSDCPSPAVLEGGTSGAFVPNNSCSRQSNNVVECAPVTDIVEGTYKVLVGCGGPFCEIDVTVP